MRRPEDLYSPIQDNDDDDEDEKKNTKAHENDCKVAVCITRGVEYNRSGGMVRQHIRIFEFYMTSICSSLEHFQAMYRAKAARPIHF